jgi:hypothetical protein
MDLVIYRFCQHFTGLRILINLSQNRSVVKTFELIKHFSSLDLVAFNEIVYALG